MTVPTSPPDVNDQTVEEQTAGGEMISAAEEAFERYRRLAGVALAPLAFAVTWWLVPVTPTLKPEGRRLSAVLAAVAVLWVTETLPLPVTALLGAVLCIVLGVAPAKEVLAPFADPIVFLFLGSFMLARAMSLHGLDKRIALGFLSIPWLGRHPARMLGGLGAVTALISMWVSNTATTAMMLPIGLGILAALWEVRRASGLVQGPMDARNWPFATGMMLMIAYAASIGGIGTPVGSPPNLIGLGHLRDRAGVTITFFQWMALCVPMLVVMGAALFVLMYALHPVRRSGSTSAEPVEAEAARMAQYVRGERDRLGRWSAGQVNTLIAFGLAIALWMLPGFMAAFLGDAHPRLKTYNARMPEQAVALVAAILLFVLPVNLSEGRFTLNWRQAVEIDWGTILLFGGGLSLGALMGSTGVSPALGEQFKAVTGASSVWAMTAVTIVAGIVLSEATSNTTASTMLVPIAIAAAQAAQVSPVPPALGAVLGASYGFMLPVSTPPNAIVYGSGLVPIPRMVRAGVIFDVLGFFIVWTGLRVLCPLLGLA